MSGENRGHVPSITDVFNGRDASFTEVMSFFGNYGAKPAIRTNRQCICRQCMRTQAIGFLSTQPPIQEVIDEFEVNGWHIVIKENCMKSYIGTCSRCQQKISLGIEEDD